jgi:molybdenum cofactor guanylyltransferase
MNTLGIILAGGQSSRMGTNKALLSIGNDHLLTHMQNMMCDTDISHLEISGPLSNQGVSNIVDMHPKMGPLGGIYSVFIQIGKRFLFDASVVLAKPTKETSQDATSASKLKSINTNGSQFDGVIFVPVDLPLMTSQTINKLISVGSSSKQACYFEGSNLPLYLPYKKTITQFLADKIAKKDKLSIGSLIHYCNAQAIKIDNETELTNTNTPTEWEATQQLINAKQ